MQSAERCALGGIAACAGIAIGPAAVMDSRLFNVPHHHVESDEIDFEISRLRKAIDGSRRELEQIRERLGDGAPADYRLILDAHLMMHSDELLVDGAAAAIREERICAEWAAQRVVEGIGRHLAQASEVYFRDRAVDVEHVGNRILAQLVGKASSLPTMEPGRVLVVQELHPADAVQLPQRQVLGLVAELGSATSHAAIIVRGMKIPAVVGVEGAVDRIGSGDLVIVDGLRGQVIVGADEMERQQAEARSKRYRVFTGRLRANRGAPSQTRDGVRIRLMANMGRIDETSQAWEEQAQGIGLCRTEFLFADLKESPSEQEQAKVYSEILEAMSPRPVVFRTFGAPIEPVRMRDAARDATGTAPGTPRWERGQRALRSISVRPQVLLMQLRALLRASVHGSTGLMFPFISGTEELRRGLAALDQARTELRASRVQFGSPSVGVMIELPAAVMTADRLAGECDFLSVGTNDLVQYLLAAGRSDPSMAHLADPMNPAVLRSLDMVVQAARGRDVHLSMCGGMASDPFALPVAVGLGYREFSVPVGLLPLVREVIRRIDSTEAHVMAREVLDAATVFEVRELVTERFADALGELWREAGAVTG